MKTQNERYKMVIGKDSQVEIVDTRNPERGVLFRLRSHDGRFARKFLSRLNRRRSEG